MLGGTERGLPSLPSSQNSNWEYHRPELRLEGFPAASLSIDSLQKSCRSDASANE